MALGCLFPCYQDEQNLDLVIEKRKSKVGKLLNAKVFKVFILRAQAAAATFRDLLTRFKFHSFYSV